VKIGVVAHHSRLPLVHPLMKAVSADYISVDQGDLGPINNHRRCWEMVNQMAARSEWCFVIEDDAKPVAGQHGFRRELVESLLKLPKGADVVSLYLGRERPPQWQDKVRQAVSAAQSSGVSWIRADVVLHGVALGMKGDLVSKMLFNTKDSPRPFDEAMTQWVRRFGHVVAYTFPSLVDHRDDLPSLVNDRFDGHPREPGRVAWYFGTRENWTDRSVSL
jgi:hypothetical protein